MLVVCKYTKCFLPRDSSLLVATILEQIHFQHFSSSFASRTLPPHYPTQKSFYSISIDDDDDDDDDSEFFEEQFQ